MIMVGYLEQLIVFHPDIQGRLSTACADHSFHKINRKAYTEKKERILLAKQLLDERTDMTSEEQEALIKLIFDEPPPRKSSNIISQAVSYISGSPPTPPSPSDQPLSQLRRQEARQQANKFNDSDFLSQLSKIVEAYPALADAASDAAKQACEHLTETLTKHVDSVASRTEHARLEEFKRRLKDEIEKDQRRQEDESRRQFLEEVQDAYKNDDRTGG